MIDSSDSILTLARVVQAGIMPVDTFAVLSELGRETKLDLLNTKK